MVYNYWINVGLFAFVAYNYWINVGLSAIMVHNYWINVGLPTMFFLVEPQQYMQKLALYIGTVWFTTRL